MWLAPAFLLGLLGMGLPLWLHRFARRTDERRPFASLMLIEAGEVRRSRRQQLRYWLLLALRLALLILLVLALAGPQWPRKADAGAQADARLHLLVLDTSLSMQRAGVWAQAQQQAGSVLDSLQGGDRVLCGSYSLLCSAMRPVPCAPACAICSRASRAWITAT